MSLSAATGHNKTPLVCHILNTLFGSGIVVFLMSAIYGATHLREGLILHTLCLSACYSFIILLVGVWISLRYRSAYGTPLLNMSRLLARWCMAVMVVILLGIALVYCHTHFWKASIPLRYLFGGLTILANLAGLILVRNISSAIKRQFRYPVLEGCTFLFIGERHKAEEYWNSIPSNEKRGLRAYFYNPRKSEGKTETELQTIIEASFVEKAVFLEPAEHGSLIRQCAIQGIEVWTPPPDEGDEPLINHFTIQKNAPPLTALKFGFDQFAALLMILASSPIWLIAAIGIRLSDKGPVFYQQARSGLYGKHFGMWKFRSMYTDAEARLDDVKARFGNEMSGPIFKLEHDPRIFPFGRIIRKLSIDELPQLLNVLFGDMSLVGPRPLPVYETEAFGQTEYRKRLCVLPGLTCFWQIEGRSNITDFDELVKLDYKYIEEYSFLTDIKLLLRTIPAVLFAKGAK